MEVYIFIIYIQDELEWITCVNVPKKPSTAVLPDNPTLARERATKGVSDSFKACVRLIIPLFPKLL